MLGFSSTNDRRDGRFRKLDVRVKRPGLIVRGRTGYMAPLRNERPPDPPKPARTSASRVSEALRSTVAVNGLPMRVFAAPFKGAERNATVVMAVEVDASQLGLVEKDGVHAGALEVSYFSIDMRNKISPGQTQTARLTLKPETYQQVMKTGMRMMLETELAPGRYQMRIAAGNRDEQSRQRRLRPRRAGLLEDAAGVERRHDRIRGDVAHHDDECEERVRLHAPRQRHRDARIRRRRRRSGSTSKRTRTCRTPRRTRSTFTAELRAEGGTAVRKVSEERSSSELQGKRGGYGFNAQLPLDDVAPGLYVIHVEARANAGDRPAVSRDIQIRVR